MSTNSKKTSHSSSAPSAPRKRVATATKKGTPKLVKSSKVPPKKTETRVVSRIVSVSDGKSKSPRVYGSTTVSKKVNGKPVAVGRQKKTARKSSVSHRPAVHIKQEEEEENEEEAQARFIDEQIARYAELQEQDREAEEVERAYMEQRPDLEGDEEEEDDDEDEEEEDEPLISRRRIGTLLDISNRLCVPQLPPVYDEEAEANSVVINGMRMYQLPELYNRHGAMLPPAEDDDEGVADANSVFFNGMQMFQLPELQNFNFRRFRV